MDYIYNSQKYFYVTYVMHYVIITYFHSLKIFYSWEEQEKWCPRASEGVSQEREESLRRGVPGKGGKSQKRCPRKGMAQEGGKPQKGTSRQSTRPERLYIADT